MFGRTIRCVPAAARPQPICLTSATVSVSTFSPPAFLLPIRARRSFNSTTQIVDAPSGSADISRDAPFVANLVADASRTGTSSSSSASYIQASTSAQLTPNRRIPPAPPVSPSFTSTPKPLHANTRALLPLLLAQPQHYSTIHIHGRPYLVTAGDVLRLPFRMPGVVPGDVLRLNRATAIGSRDWTLKGGIGGAVASASDIAATMEQDVTTSSRSSVQPNGTTTQLDRITQRSKEKKIKNIKSAYIDETLFEIRATVMGTEGEPVRVVVKKKRRQRHARTVRSKHRFTVLRIGEVRIKAPQED